MCQDAELTTDRHQPLVLCLATEPAPFLFGRHGPQIVIAALGALAPNATFDLTVQFETKADTTLLMPVAPCTSNGHTPNIIEVDGAMADADGDDGDTGDDVAVIVDGDDKDCAEVQILNPTAVQLAARGVSQAPDGVMVQWTTVSESDMVGFNIWKSNGTDAVMRSSSAKCWAGFRCQLSVAGRGRNPQSG